MKSLLALVLVAACSHSGKPTEPQHALPWPRAVGPMPNDDMARVRLAPAPRIDPYATQIAFMEACASGNTTRASTLYTQLSPRLQSRLARICVRAAGAEPVRAQNSPPQSPPMPTPIPQNCDYDELFAESREAFDQGMFAKSLAKAEAVLRCNPKPEAILQAAVAACELGNIPKRRFYVKRLTRFVDQALFLIRTKNCTLTEPDVD